MSKKDLTIDNKPFQWDGDIITGAELRVLGDVPENVQIFHQVPGAPDREIELDDKVDLSATAGIDRFSTDTADSGAGADGVVAG